MTGGSSENITLESGSGTITVSGAVGTDGNMTLQENAAGASGAVSLPGSVAANTLTTFAQAYDVSLTGAVNSISTDTTFLNAGAITVGDESTDSSTFAGGGHDGRGTENFAGTVAATDNQIDIGVASVTADATIDGGTGAINTAALTVADAATLTVGLERLSLIP